MGRLETLLFRLPLLVLASAAGCGGGTGPVDDTGPFAAEGAAAQVGRDASNRFEQLVDQDDADPVGKVIAELQDDPNVLSATHLTSSGVIMIEMTNGVGFGMSIADKGRPEWVPAGSTSPFLTAPIARPWRGSASRPSRGPLMSLEQLREQVDRAGLVCDPANFPQSKKACVVNGFQSEFQQNMTSVNASLTRAGFNPTPFALRNVADLVNLRTELGTCGVLYISSHGTMSQDLATGTRGTHIVTEIEVPSDPAARDQLSTSLTQSWPDGRAAVGMTSHKGKQYFTLSPYYFAAPDYPNTFVYADACNSADASGGATTLKEMVRLKGAGGFVGWEGPISTKVSNPAADQIFDALAPKVGNITGVTVSVNPPAPGPNQSYVVSATIAPAGAGIEVQLSVRGTDGFTRDETKTTNASGQVTFASIPGGASGVTDLVTVSAGGAQDSQAAVNAVGNNPTLQTVYKLKWSPADGSLSQYNSDFVSNFNLACNNANTVKTQSVVKF
jgi:hypothetical protein